jgi:AcrR family transcriptional regulator
MVSPLEKARQDPDSMKARILASARKLFGEYSFHGTTTRMIAQDVGIDISTLYYHWGEKIELYEAVLTDVNEEIRRTLIDIEKIARGKSIAERLEIAIDIVSDYLFARPEISNMILNRYFGKNRHNATVDINVPEYISDIAIALGLSLDKKSVSVQAKARVIAVWNSILNFISGENFLRPMLDIHREEYIQVVKDTLKFILIPAFTRK